MRPRHKETGAGPGRASRGRAALLVGAGIAASLVAGACGGTTPRGVEATPTDPDQASPEPPPLRAAPPGSEALDAELARLPEDSLAPFRASADPAERRMAVRALGRCRAGDAAAQLVAPLLRDPDDAVRVEACFAVGVTGSRLAASLLSPVVESGPSAAELSALTLGLGSCGDDASAELLVRIGCLERPPVEAPEAMLRHVRSRPAPWAGPLPDARLLRYEQHADARGRAGVGWMGRIWKDAVLLEPLLRLTRDPEAEVRRAAALGLADARGKDPRRPAADADRAVAALAALADDADVRVAVSACRALASYERDDAAEAVRARLAHPSFHVRTVACDGLGARKWSAAFDDLAALATGDPSPLVRGSAANALGQIDGAKAQTVVDSLLASPSAFVRAAGASLLGSDASDATTDRLLALLRTDAHVLVREAALDALKGRKTDATKAAVRETIAGDDPVLVYGAADVAATNEWKDLLPDLRAALPRHAGTKGADAREGIAAALGALGEPSDQDLLRRIASDDPEAGPRKAAADAVTEIAQRMVPGETPAPAAPGTYDRRPRPEGSAMPLGAPRLDHDVDLVVETDQGTLRIRLDASEAPLHAAHLADLARKGFYDGLTWHRVVPDFVIQGGCPRGDGSGNAGVSLPLEPTRTPFERGTLGMPRSSHPDTGGCQLFVCHSRAPHLDVTYAAIGRVVEGLDVIDRIDVGSRIVRVRVVEPR